MSTPLFADGEVFLNIRTKINGINEYFRIAETDEIILSGATTSIPVAALERNLLPSGSKVYLVNSTTGDAYELTLSSGAVDEANALTIVEYTFLTDIPAGSSIFYRFDDLLARIYSV